VAIGAIDEHGVGERNVEAFSMMVVATSSVFMAHEGEHDELEFRLVIWRDRRRHGPRDKLLNARGDFIDGLNAVVNEVDLARVRVPLQRRSG